MRTTMKLNPFYTYDIYYKPQPIRHLRHTPLRGVSNKRLIEKLKAKIKIKNRTYKTQINTQKSKTESRKQKANIQNIKILIKKTAQQQSN